MVTKINNHIVNCGDVMEDISILSIMGSDKADIFYSDPPWGAGNLKYWQTMNYKMNAVERKDIDLEKFLQKIFHIAKNYSKGIIFIEYGIGWREKVIDYGNKFGLYHKAIIPLKYKSGNKFLPLDLHIFSHTEELIISKEYIESVSYSHGLDTLRRAVTPFAKSGNMILDPCCGMGYTCQIALDLDMIFRGNELNKKRLDRTIERIKNKYNE